MSEHDEAVAFIKRVRIEQRRAPELGRLYAIPNGGHRNINVARKMKAEGVIAGVSDYFLSVPVDGFHGLYIELKDRKRPGRKTSYPTAEQKEWIAESADYGYCAVVAWGWIEAWNHVADYLGRPSWKLVEA